MKANEVKLGDTVYQLGCNLRTRIMYEKMCGKFFGEEMMTFEQVVFFFCSLTTTNDNFQMDLESFMDLLSADETPMNDFFQWEISYFKEVASLSGKESKSNDKKKG